MNNSQPIALPEENIAVIPAAEDRSAVVASRLATASLVFGIIGAAFLPLGLIPGFLGFTLSLDAKRRGCSDGNMRAGRALSLVAMLALPALYLLFLFIGFEAVLLALV